MKLLVLCPGKIAADVSSIVCFSDGLNYYLPKSLEKIVDTTIKQIPEADNDQLREIFSKLPVDEYDAILTLGLRFYSRISQETTALLRNRFKGLFCQVYDGTRLDLDPVDITFTFKNDDQRMMKNKDRYERHKNRNVCMGWAADSQLNTPQQSTTDLRILVDHTNYGGNHTDITREVLQQVKEFVASGAWQSMFETVSVRRFDSNGAVDVDFNTINDIQPYVKSRIPLDEITKEHCAAHIFCVTHPESVGLVVLETALAGALPVVPKGFVSRDRLNTIRHVEWRDQIYWDKVMKFINVESSRQVALNNTWDKVAERIRDTLQSRIGSKV